MHQSPDEGSIFFIQRSDPSIWWYFPKITGTGVKNNWEGLTVDTGDSSDHLYMVYEGKSDGNDCARLTKIEYTFGTPNVALSPDNTYTVISTVCVSQLNNKLTGDDGVESLALYKPSSGGQGPEFLMGVQKTGVVWGVKANGDLNGIELRHNLDRISGSQYLPNSDVLLTVADYGDYMQAVYVNGGCILKEWNLRGANEEGMVIAGPDLYIADDAGNMYIHPNFDLQQEFGGSTACCLTDSSQFTSEIANPPLGNPLPTPAPVTSSPSKSPTPAPVAPTPSPVTSPTASPVVTPSCGGNKASCASTADCCSNNCKRGSCKGNGRRLGQGAPAFLENE